MLGELMMLRGAVSVLIHKKDLESQDPCASMYLFKDYFQSRFRFFSELMLSLFMFVTITYSISRNQEFKVQNYPLVIKSPCFAEERKNTKLFFFTCMNFLSWLTVGTEFSSVTKPGSTEYFTYIATKYPIKIIHIYCHSRQDTIM